MSKNTSAEASELTLIDAAMLAGVPRHRMMDLITTGKVVAVRRGHFWFVTRESMLSLLKTMADQTKQEKQMVDAVDRLRHLWAQKQRPRRGQSG